MVRYRFLAYDGISSLLVVRSLETRLSLSISRFFLVVN